MSASFWFDLEVETVAGEDAMGAIDFPRPSTKLYGDQLEICGWATGRDAPVAGIEAGAVGEETASVVAGLPRPDVVATFPDLPHAARSGFYLIASIPPPANTSAGSETEVVVRAVLANGERANIGAIRLLPRRRQTWSQGDEPVVSVVIPCYNQAHFLRDAIESVRRQTYQRIETLVVDDGSTDDTAAVASELGVSCIRQENGGPSAARNKGLAATRGEFVVFLDADDRLLPNGIVANLDAFEARPDAAFVSGWGRFVDPAGKPIGSPLQPVAPEHGHYVAFLSAAYWTHTPAVMFRRGPLDEAGGYDESTRAAEDWDLYLRISRERAVYPHERGPICVYRQHTANSSKDSARMLKGTLTTLRRQRKWVQGDDSLRDAYRRGAAVARNLYGAQLAHDLALACRRRSWDRAIRILPTLVRFYPGGLLSLLMGSRKPSR